MNNENTIKKWAKLIDGREYLHELFEQESGLAASDGIVIVFAYSDDNLEFRGAIVDEVSCYDGCSVFVNQDGLSGDCPHSVKIEAIDSNDPHNNTDHWIITSAVNHETFLIMEDGDVFCRGIVFSMKDIKEI